MAYKTQDFVNNATILTGEMLEHIERGIVDNESAIANERERITNIVSEKFVTPQMFGAVGDGVADDTEAFVQAFKHPCFIPEDTYRITSTLTVSYDVIGFSVNTVKFLPSGCSTLFHIKDAVRITVKNIQIVGNNTETAIILENTRNSWFERIRVEGCGTGFCVVGNTWANVFDTLVLYRNTNGFLNESESVQTFGTTILQNSYIGSCTNAFKVTGASLDIIGGWIEYCETIFNVTNTLSLCTISCSQLDMENNTLLLSVGGGTLTTNFSRFSFCNCTLYNFKYWFSKLTDKNIALFFDVSGGAVGNPSMGIFTTDSQYCRWGTNLPDNYLKKTTPFKLCKCKTNAIYFETSIPVELIQNNEYIFPEQVLLSSINIPEGMTATVHGYDGGELVSKTYSGNGAYKAVQEPCYKIVFSSTPTENVPIKVPRNAHTVVI